MEVDLPPVSYDQKTYKLFGQPLVTDCSTTAVWISLLLGVFEGHSSELSVARVSSHSSLNGASNESACVFATHVTEGVLDPCIERRARPMQQRAC